MPGECATVAPMSEQTRSIAECTLVEITEALQHAEFHFGDAAKMLGVSRAGLKDFIDRTPELLSMVEDASESMVDDAERVIRNDLKSNDSGTAKFVASTKGKNRGWSSAGLSDKGNIIVEVRQFADPANGGGDGSKG